MHNVGHFILEKQNQAAKKGTVSSLSLVINQGLECITNIAEDVKASWDASDIAAQHSGGGN